MSEHVYIDMILIGETSIDLRRQCPSVIAHVITFYFLKLELRPFRVFICNGMI